MGFQYDNTCRDRGDITNGFKASNRSERLLERHSVAKERHEVIKVKAINNYVLCLPLYNFNATALGHIKNNPITGLDRP
jgi:FMN-dependent NADH-azoreductase